MKNLKEEIIHIPQNCMIAAVDVLKQIHSRALIVGANELNGTVAVKITYDADSEKSAQAVANLEWFQESIEEYLQGNDVLPDLKN